MIKLLKNLKRREIIMAVICALLILGQIYFDLTLPDYMTDITKLINSPDPQTADIMSIGLKMLGCALASALLAVVCGYLAARVASGFSYTVREKVFGHVMDFSSEQLSRFAGAESHHPHHERHHPASDDRRNGAADDDQIPCHGRVGGDKNSRQELGSCRP